MKVTAGTILFVDVLRWEEGWEFDQPVCVLRPVVRFSPNGVTAERMAEDLCVDAAVDGSLTGDDEGLLVDRQFRLSTLKQRWAAARRGVAFRAKRYTASRFRARFYTDARGELAFEMTPEKRRTPSIQRGAPDA